MANLVFSEQFSGVLQKVVKALPKTPILIFKEDGLSRMSYSKNGLLFHISASPDDFDYEGEMIGLPSLTEFNDYTSAIGFPKTGEISLVREMSISGHPYDFVKFVGNKKTLRCRMVDLAFFTEDSKDIPASQEENTLTLVGKLSLPKDSIKELFTSRKLAPGCDNVTITCHETKITITMRGTIGQQVDIDYCYPNVTIDQEAVSKAYANSVLRMFPIEMFKLMDAMGMDYTIELRYAPGQNGGQMALCSYATVPGKNGTPINIYIGTVESEAATIANVDMIV